ncbi:unnamed protein product [Spirodela intermedia]|uniref:Uncharacterized protein n=1 Tax=Spirodela intermedia TaxID=51605 RepID=A0A7I8J9U7_SPIIN|nr:unnamed protein product [Spirodela intermedia]CAA6666996.1 unnamed protein product [Spirodela intermedia]
MVWVKYTDPRYILQSKSTFQIKVQRCHKSSKFRNHDSTLQSNRGRLVVVSSTLQNRQLNQSFIRSSGTNPSAQISININLYTFNVIPKCYKCGENIQKSNIYLKCDMVNFIDSIEEQANIFIYTELVESRKKHKFKFLRSI